MHAVILLTCSGLRPDGLADEPAGACVGHPEWAVSCAADTDPRKRGCMKKSYIRSLSRAGGVPLLLPNLSDPDYARAAVAACDGLLLSGGGDVDPALYGQVRHPTVGGVDPMRDAVEQAAIDEALRRGKPILGICRGTQILNVALGGTLIQDIPSRQQTHVPSTPVLHRGAEHPVRVEEGSLLARLWGKREITVNSRHHQAVDTLAEGLRATAWSPDGIVEAVESTDGRRILALQCHPEDLSEQPEFLALFQWLTNEAVGR